MGGVFLPLEVTFSNQNNATRTIELALEDGSEFEITSTDSFLSGEGNAFTAYFLTETTFDGQTFDAVDAYSGMVTEAGIENFQRALLIVDDRGDPGDRVSPNGSTDLFFDMDALSERVP